MKKGLASRTGKFVSTNLGQAGIAYTNVELNFTNFHHVIPIMTFGDLHPLSLSLIYNHAERNVNIGFGNGVRSNLSFDIELFSNYIKMKRPDGSIEKFNKTIKEFDGEEKTCYIGEYSFEIILKINDDYVQFTTKDNYTYILSFDCSFPHRIYNNGIEIYEIDFQNTEVSIYFTQGGDYTLRIIKESSSGNYIRVNGSCLLSPDSGSVLFFVTDLQYTNLFLSSIKQLKHIEYNAHYLLNECSISVTDTLYRIESSSDKTITSFSFTNGKVSGIEVKTNDYNLFKQSISYEPTYSKVEDVNGDYTEYYFYNDGLVQYVVDSKANYIKYLYDEKFLVQEIAGDLNAKYTSSANNYLKNGSFDSGLTNWTVVGDVSVNEGSPGPISAWINHVCKILQNGKISQTFNHTGDINTTFALAFWLKNSHGSTITTAKIELLQNGSVIAHKDQEIHGHHQNYELALLEICAPRIFNQVRVSFAVAGGGLSQTTIANIIVKSKPLRTNYEYDENGNIVKTTQGLFFQNSEYDDYNKLIKNYNLGGSGSRYFYTKDGILLQANTLTFGTKNIMKNTSSGQLIEKSTENDNQLMKEVYSYPSLGSGNPSMIFDSREQYHYYDYTPGVKQIENIYVDGNDNRFQYDNYFRLIGGEISSSSGSNKVVHYAYSLDYIDELHSVSTQLRSIKNNSVAYDFTYSSRDFLTKVDFKNQNPTSGVKNLTKYRYENEGDETSFQNFNLIEKEYPNGKFTFAYNAQDLMTNTKYILDDEETSLYSYEYNIFEQLISSVNDQMPDYTYEYTYNQDGRLSSVTQNEVTQNFSYNNVGSNSSVLTYFDINKARTEFNHNYRIYGFDPEEMYAIFQYSPIRYCNFANLFKTEIVESVSHATVLESIRPELICYQKNGDVITKKEIVAKEKDYRIIHDGRFNAFKFNQGANTYLEYTQHYSTNPIFTDDAFTIGFWFKLDSLEQDTCLALIVNGDDRQSIVQINCDEQNTLHVNLKFIDSSIDYGFISSIARVRQGWNFVSFSWKRFDDSALSEFILGLNGEYTRKVKQNSTALIFPNGAKLFIGAGSTPQNPALVEMDGAITGIFIESNYYIDVQSIIDYYKITRRLYLYAGYLDLKTSTTSNAGVNDYPKLEKIHSSYKVFPLHNDLFATNGTSNLVYVPSYYLKNDIDQVFDFNKELKRYMYTADGDYLVYRTGLNESGFIGMYFVRHEDNEMQYLFECKSSSGFFFGIVRKLQGGYRQFLLEVEGGTYVIGMDNGLDKSNYLGVTWSKMITGDSLNVKVYLFRVVLNNIEKNFTIQLTNDITSVDLSLGRRFNDRLILNGSGETSDPLFGQIELLTYNSLFMSKASIDTLKIDLQGSTTSLQSDGLGLLKKENVTFGDKEIKSTEYGYYIPNSTQKVSGLISKEIVKTITGSVTKTYEYDVFGNITKSNDPTNGTTIFAYDKRGFLTSLSKPNSSHQETYTYDLAGNILSVGGIRDVTYTYETSLSQNLQRLIKVDDQNIEYLGNSLLPKRIYKTIAGIPATLVSFTWQGRRLLSYNSFQTQISYQYNDEGLRLFKNVNGTETLYTYFGDQLVLERTGNQTIRYLYNANNILYGFSYYSGTLIKTYFYDRDLLGNIIGIFDETGNKIVHYYYDAYGNILSIQDTSGSSIGSINKLRYKGYYYDEETSFYYCKSRYYVPKWCRWLSGDDVGYLDSGSPSGLNLFVYCGNNPVMYLDSNGHSWESFWEVTRWVAVGVVGALAVGAIAAGIILSGGLGAVLIGAGAGAILGGFTGASIAVSNGTDISTGILSGAIKGAALGAAAPLSGFGLVGFGIMLGTTSIAGSASYAIDRLGNGNSFNLGDMLIVGGSTSIQGILSFGVGKLFNIGGKVDLTTKLTISYLSKVYAGHIGFTVDLITSYAIGSPWTAQELATNYAAIWLS